MEYCIALHPILRKTLYKAIIQSNEELRADSYSGLKPTKIGDDIGFNIDNGLLQVDFSSQLTEEGRPCLVLNYNVYSRFE